MGVSGPLVQDVKNSAISMNKIPQFKVCGNRDPENIRAMVAVKPDYLGFIFYPKSKRFTSWQDLAGVISEVPPQIQRVGVFVNQDLEFIDETASKLEIGIIQLHGNESPDLGFELKEKGYRVWKVFGLGTEPPDWEKMKDWPQAADVFLFDTASAQHGGTGRTFSHQILSSYPFQIPFIISGGIGPDFRTLPQFFDGLPFLGLDINSRFESEPGIKNRKEVDAFVSFWRHKKNQLE